MNYLQLKFRVYHWKWRKMKIFCLNTMTNCTKFFSKFYRGQHVRKEGYTFTKTIINFFHYMKNLLAQSVLRMKCEKRFRCYLHLQDDSLIASLYSNTLFRLYLVDSIKTGYTAQLRFLINSIFIIRRNIIVTKKINTINGIIAKVRLEIT